MTTVLRSVAAIARVLSIIAVVVVGVWSAEPPSADTPIDGASTGDICLNPPPPPKNCCRICTIFGAWELVNCNVKQSTIVNVSLDYTHTGVDYRVFSGGSAGCSSCGGAPAAPEGVPGLQITRYHRPVWVSKGAASARRCWATSM